MEIRFVSHEMIVIFTLPKRSRESKDSTGLSAGVGLPGMNYSRKVVRAECPEQNMNVVWHNAPSEYLVTAAFKTIETLGHQSGDSRVSEGTSPGACIKIRFNFTSRQFRQPGPLARRQVSVQRVRGGDDIVSLETDAAEYVNWQRIRKSKGNEVRRRKTFPMRQPSAIANRDHGPDCTLRRAGETPALLKPALSQ
jgi:hypothetical protein